MLAHGPGRKPRLHLDLQPAGPLIGGVQQVGGDRRVFRGMDEGGGAEGRHGLAGHHPGRDGGQEALAQKGAEGGLVELDGPGRPVVQQAIAEDVRLGLGDGDGLTEPVAPANEGGELQLEIQLRLGAIDHLTLFAGELAQRPDHLRSRDPERAGPAVVADGQVQEHRPHRPAAHAHHVVGGAGEVGVVADRRRQLHGGSRHGDEQLVCPRLGRGLAWPAGAQQVRHPPPERRDQAWLQPHQGVERGAGSGLGGDGGVAREQTLAHTRRQVENLVADGDPALGLSARTPEDPERQVLDREVRLWRIGRGHPALAGGVVGLVQVSHDDDPGRQVGAASVDLMTPAVMRAAGPAPMRPAIVQFR